MKVTPSESSWLAIESFSPMENETPNVLSLRVPSRISNFFEDFEEEVLFISWNDPEAYFRRLLFLVPALGLPDFTLGVFFVDLENAAVWSFDQLTALPDPEVSSGHII